MQASYEFWDTVWGRLQERFRNLAGEVSQSNPDIGWQWGHDVDLNQYYPFTAFASAKQTADPVADEELVISIDWQRTDGHLTLSSGIDGVGLPKLLEGPTASISLVDSVPRLQDKVVTSMEKVDRWLAEETDVIVRTLTMSDTEEQRPFRDWTTEQLRAEYDRLLGEVVQNGGASLIPKNEQLRRRTEIRAELGRRAMEGHARRRESQ